MARPKKVKEAVVALDEPAVAASEAPIKEVKETAKALPGHPLYSAELEITSRFDYDTIALRRMLKGFPENEGYLYYGHVFNDTATHGEHPFADGHFIHTSLVISEEVTDGVRYIKTLNTTYKVRESAPPHEVS